MTVAYSKARIKAWLLDYAWSGTPEQQAAEVDCIMAQDGWKAIDGMTEKYVGQSWDPGGEGVLDEANGFALSALYECHDAPHLPTCPLYREEAP